MKVASFVVFISVLWSAAVWANDSLFDPYHYEGKSRQYALLLTSDDAASVRMAARDIYTDVEFNHSLIDIVALRLSAFGRLHGGVEVDAAAWCGRVLEKYGSQRHDVILNTVLHSVNSTKVRRYLRRTLKESSLRRNTTSLAPDDGRLLQLHGDLVAVTNGLPVKPRVVAKKQKPVVAPLSADDQRLIDELAVDDAMAIRFVAKKIISDQRFDVRLLDHVAEKVLVNALEAKGRLADSIAWLCKALAASGNSRYYRALNAAKVSGKSSSLRMHARFALKKLEYSAANQYRQGMVNKG